ncbi:MAG: hypothetical protein HYX72_10225 [Acidobacteria bacterium]|nr:hypothetical protein [Acidobacteriota bacterium]
MAPPRREICDCGVLERASKEPEHPIRFDPHLNEYHVVTKAGGIMIIYYCFFCGGRVPESKRSSLFAHATDAELNRITHLIKGINTVSDVLARFGVPDEDTERISRVGHPGDDRNPPSGEWFLRRTLVYKNISETIQLHFSVGANDSVHPSWHGKYIGPPKPISD